MDGRDATALYCKNKSIIEYSKSPTQWNEFCFVFFSISSCNQKNRHLNVSLDRFNYKFDNFCYQRRPKNTTKNYFFSKVQIDMQVIRVKTVTSPHDVIVSGVFFSSFLILFFSLYSFRSAVTIHGQYDAVVFCEQNKWLMTKWKLILFGMPFLFFLKCCFFCCHGITYSYS